MAIYEKKDTIEALVGFSDDVILVLRKGDKGMILRTFLNNLRFGMSLDELFNQERLNYLREVKNMQDADRIFWSPYKV